jgi:alcohol dehydrogenase class IV
MSTPDIAAVSQLGEFQLALPRSVRFGWGVRRQLPGIAGTLGSRVWLVIGSRTLFQNGLVDDVQLGLSAAGIGSEVLATITREPVVDDVDAAVVRLQRAGPRDGDVVVAIGGGSAIDLGKSVAALTTNRHGDSVRDFLEGVGRGLAIERPPLPFIAVPTTSGTGSEATRNAVISSHDPPFKKSLRSERMIPAAVLLDPELTISCPHAVTAHSGMDAITQLIESLTSRRANAFTQAICRDGLRQALPAISVAVRDGSNRPAREAMQYSAFLSGVALANSGLGLAHGVAAALGVHCDLPHGLACAVMLPAAMRFNLEARTAELAEVGRLLYPERRWSRDADAAEAAVAGIEQLNRELGIPASLAKLGVTSDQTDALVPASHGNSLSGNPRPVSDEDLRSLLQPLCG